MTIPPIDQTLGQYEPQDRLGRGGGLPCDAGHVGREAAVPA